MDKAEVKLDDIKGTVGRGTPAREQFEPITVQPKMKLTDLIQLQTRTAGRFSFVVHQSGLYATCRYVNYIYNADESAIYVWTVHDPENKKFLGSALITDQIVIDIELIQ